MLDKGERLQHGLELKALAGRLDGLADVVLDAEEEALVDIRLQALAVVRAINNWARDYSVDVGD